MGFQKCIHLFLLHQQSQNMSFNSYQSTFQTKNTHPPSDTNPITSPAKYYQSPVYKPPTKTTSEFQPQQYIAPSSMSNNFFQVGSNVPAQRFSPAQFNKKQENWKNNDLGTAKSMVFMGSNQGSATFNQPQKITSGLTKLSSMARTADKNFDDSGDFNQGKSFNFQQNSANFHEEKIATYKKYGNTLGEQSNKNSKGYQLKQPSVSSSMFFNIGQQSKNIYKSFINPATNSIAGSDFKKTGGLDFLLKYKEEKRQRQYNNTQTGQNKGPSYSEKVLDNGNKNYFIPSDNAHQKLFHQYSAPILGHVAKNPTFQPVKTPIITKIDSFSKPTASLYDSPTHTINSQLHYNKYSPPQQQGSSPTFLNKYNSDKFNNRFNPSKKFTFELNPVQNQQGISNFSPSTAFAKKETKVNQDMKNFQETTPNKQKFLSPSFFKNKQAKLSEAKTLETIPSPSSLKINQFNDSSESPTRFKSSLSDNGSNDSIDYMNEDFGSEGNKEWELDDFELGDKLGKGAFGDVFIARQKKLGFMCVLKKMSKKRIKELKREEHVIRQLKIQMYLSHKHLTAMYGYFHEKDHIYLILEYLPDGDLSQIKKRKKTSEKQTANIVKQVCEGLEFMHKHSIIHRDIKPENIFCNQGYIKLGDFGCAINTDGLRKTIVSCLEYSSPEQLNGGEYNEKIDIWGIGILAYELLTGKSPYEKQIMKMGNEQVDFSRLNFPEELKLSQIAKGFIKQLLNVDPIDRLDIHEALEHKFIKQNYEPPVQIC